MPNKPTEYISGWKTDVDWNNAKATLTVGGEPAVWKKAFDDFFRTRLELRYLTPIKVLQDNGTFSGEGFSIVAIQCSLIEFLESSVRGLKYRWVRNPAQLANDEYSSSSQIFEDFLTTRHPFAPDFLVPAGAPSIAHDFYVGVRCGLLHEARTKNGWRVRASDPLPRTIDPANKIVFRDNFQKALLEFVDAYGVDLEQDAAYQAAFIKKFDDLCQ